MKKRELSRDEMVMLFVIDTLNKLSRKGILTGGCLKINKDYINDVRSMNPKPNYSEIEMALSALRSSGYLE